jgi:hypothetical protein
MAVRNAILASLLLAASGLALLPPASAAQVCPEQPQPCSPPPSVGVLCDKWIDQPPVVHGDRECRVLVTLDLFSCPFGERTVIHTAGPVTVQHDWCTSCGACPPPADSSSMADPFPTCVRECSPLPTEACELRDLTATVHERLVHPVWGYDCTLDVETACLGGSDRSIEGDIGFVNVSIALCDGPDWS